MNIFVLSGMVAVAILIQLIVVVLALRKGTIGFGGQQYPRAQTPKRFWLLVIWWIAFVAMSLTVLADLHWDILN